MKQTIITILLALVWVTGQAQNTGSAPADTYWRNEATGDWLIGITKDYVIYDNKVWSITSQMEKKDAYVLTLESGTIVKVSKQKKGLRSIAIGGRKILIK